MVDEHGERHGAGSQTIRDLVLGMADGLTVPFALAAGVTGAVAASGIVVTAGLAEIVGGAISMGLGGFLAARSEAAHYAKEYAREVRETQEIPNEEKAEVARLVGGALIPRWTKGEIGVPLAGVFSLSDAPAAYEFFAQPGKFGKVVLRVDE